MYETINPMCAKAILARMKPDNLKRHYRYLLRQLDKNLTENQQAMYFDLARFCYFHAKRVYPKLDLMAP